MSIMSVYLAVMNRLSTFYTHLECSHCGEHFDPHQIQSFCLTCITPLVAKYDLVSAKNELSKSSLTSGENSLWRYFELLPVYKKESIVSLGEGMSPVIQTRKLGDTFGLSELFIKDESCNPTGSFKARGIALAVSKAKELGITEVCMPTAGNAGGALAAYAAKAGIKAHVFMPKDTPIININEAKAYDADVELVDGVISDAGKLMNEKRKTTGWFDMSTMKEPYRLEGKKTMGYELAEQFSWELPDVILYPTGGGTGLIGMWKAFSEMEKLGWIGSKRPKMVSVQAEGCAPVVTAFSQQKNTCEFWNNAHTVSSGLRVPKAFADRLILQALYQSNGIAVSVSDADTLQEIRRTARLEGILLCPEGAAAVSALHTLTQNGFIKSDDKVVVFNTGSGYKYTEVLSSISV